MHKHLATLLFVCALFSATCLVADTVYFIDGGRARGRIIEETAEHIVIETKYGRITVERSKIQRIERDETPLDEYDRRKAQIRQDDIAGQLQLAQWCSDQGLHNQAMALYEQIIALDPDHETARAELGYRREGDRWVRQPTKRSAPPPTPDNNRKSEEYQGRIIPFAEAEVIREKQNWDFRWTLESDWWRVDTNTSRQKAEEMLRALEGLRACFLSEFGGYAGVTKGRNLKMKACYYKCREDYIEQIPDREHTIHSAYYSPADNTSHAVLNPEDFTGFMSAAHEAGHQLAATYLWRGRTIPERDARAQPHWWVREGLATYCESIAINGRDEWEVGSFAINIDDNPLLARIRWGRWAIENEEWIPLGEYIMLPSSAFYLRDERIKLRYSQAACLFYYFINKDNGRFKSCLLQYLRLSENYDTRENSFVACFGVMPEDLDGDIQEYLMGLQLPEGGWMIDMDEIPTAPRQNE